MANLYVIGTCVTLKSGGPVMTIHSIGNKDLPSYWCQWFAGKKLEKGLFHHDSLVEVTTEE